MLFKKKHVFSLSAFRELLNNTVLLWLRNYRHPAHTTQSLTFPIISSSLSFLTEKKTPDPKKHLNMTYHLQVEPDMVLSTTAGADQIVLCLINSIPALLLQHTWVETRPYASFQSWWYIQQTSSGKDSDFMISAVSSHK